MASRAVPSIAPGSTHRLEVRATGPNLEGWWDGVRVVQTSTAFQQTATRHGLDWNSAYDATATYDNFELWMPAAPPAPTAPNATSPANGAATVAPTVPLSGSATSATASNVLVGDTFTGVDGALLSAHAPDVNGTAAGWVITGAAPAPRLVGGTAGVGSGGGHMQATLDAGVSDFRMAVDYRVGSGPQMGALAFRLQDADNHLLLLVYGNQLQFYYKQNGTYTLIASRPVASIAVGSTHRLEVRANGPSLEGWWDGALVVQTSTWFLQTATRHGLGWNSAYDATTKYDNFELRAP
jgi:hypothetical protein